MHQRSSICLGQVVPEGDSCMLVMSKRLRLGLWPCQTAADLGCLSLCLLPALAALQGKDAGRSQDLDPSRD